MEKTLNDQIEGVFRGVVFILLNFLVSLLILLWRPRSGYSLLVKRLRSRQTDQVRPFVFVFLALVLVLFLPAAVDALMPVQTGPYHYLVRDAEHREAGPLGRAYEQTAKGIES
jgi:hypothetical protein